MRFFTIGLVAILGLALTTGSAQAGYEFRFADSSGNELTNFTLNAPSKLDIQVYLVATGADAAGLSLSRYGVQLNYSTTSGAKVTSTGDIASNAAFTGLDAPAIGADFARSRD